MPTTIYLEAEDEITAAVGRIRALKEPEAIVVISRSSRIGTSRINFKLLAREAHAHGINLVAVSDEPTVRALAVSAGLPAYDSVAAADSALEQFRQQDEQLARRTGRLPGEPRPRPRAAPLGLRAESPAEAPPSVERIPSATAEEPSRARAPAATRPGGPRSASERERTQPLPVSRPAGQGDDVAPAPAPAATGRRARRRPRVSLVPLLLLLMLAVLTVGGVYAAYLYLPTATVTLRPQTEALGPLEVRVTADPSVAVPDAIAGVIPAERIQLQLGVGGDFPATGVQVTRTAATGTVRFQSENTLFDVPIAAGTVVSTAGGVEFETVISVTVPRASFQTGPTRVSVDVRARTDGPRGNVDARSITQLPADLAAALISVTNPGATSGGAREEMLAVTQADYDAALEQLTESLAAELETQLADPATTPRGLTLFAATVRSVEPRVTLQPAEIVDTVADSFSLSLDTTATVLAVNEALVEQVAADQLRAAVAPGQTMVGNHIEVVRGTGLALGSTILYRATASARAYHEPDREAILEEIRGKPLSEARAILERHGVAEVTIWPDVVDRLPDQAARISLTILPPQESP